MRRRWTLLTTLAAAAALVAGCGSSSSDSSGPVASSSGDAAAILKSIDLTADIGKPAKTSITLKADLKGELKDPQAAAFLGDGPIEVTLDGVTDADGKNMDLTFDAKVGKLALAGGLRAVDGAMYVELQDKWYALPSADTSSVAVPDQRKVMEALGDLTALIKDPEVVGGQNVEGVAADQIRGELDVPAAIAAIGRVMSTIDTSAAGVSVDDLAKATAELEKYIDRTQVDVWVAQDSKRVVRMAFAADIVLDGEAKDQSGLDGVSVTFDTTGAPLDEAPTVEAPENPGTEEELGQALLPLLFGAMSTP